MSATGEAMWVLRNWYSEQGVHPSDLVVEVHEVDISGATSATIATNIHRLVGGHATIFGSSEAIPRIHAFTTGTVNSATIALSTSATTTVFVTLIGSLNV